MQERSFVFILPSTHAGGGIRVLITLMNLVVNKGYKVFLYVYSDENDTRYEIDDRIKIHRYKEKGKNKFGRIVGLLSIIKTINTDHINDIVVISDQITVAIANFFRGKNIYRYIQGDDYNIYDDLHILRYNSLLRIYKSRIKHINKNTRLKVLFVSDYVREQYIKHGGNESNTRKLNPPISKGFYENGLRKQDAINLCIIGRIHKDKGFSDFIEAYRKINCRDHIDKVLVITPDDLSGFDTDGMTILHANNDSEMNEIYNQANIFISTGRNEGYGLPPLEAMATGCACILCDNGGVREFAVDGKNCMLYQVMDTEQLAKRIDDLVSDKQRQMELGEAGKRTTKRFSEEYFVNVFLGYLKEDGLI